MTARHTRQGRARGQLVGTLDRGDLDGALYDERHDYGSHTAANLRAKAREPFPEELSARLRPGKHGPMSLGGCWCGKPQGHGWWGYDEGVPHPPEGTL